MDKEKEEEVKREEVEINPLSVDISSNKDEEGGAIKETSIPQSILKQSPSYEEAIDVAAEVETAKVTRK